jgi:hypothetical protein
MPLKIEIPDSLVGSLKEYYKQVYENFKIKAQPIVDEWKEIQPILNQLGIITNSLLEEGNTKKNNVPHIEKDSNEYNSKWGWFGKSEFILKKAKEPLTSKQIVNELISSFEPEMDEKLATNSIPATLSVAAKNGKINRVKNEKGEYEYNLI